MAKKRTGAPAPAQAFPYDSLVSGIADLLDQARRSAARAVNGILTATYWEIGRRIVEHEQGGNERAAYGEELIQKLARDLSARYGRGFSKSNLFQMRAFFLGWEIFQTPSGKFQARATLPPAEGSGYPDPDRPGGSLAGALPPPDCFPLSWSHYVRLMSVRAPQGRSFYEEEAIRGGWSIRQLDRQIGTLFYERLAASGRKDVMLEKGQAPRPEDAVSAEEVVRDPYVLEFLDLKDEYSEADLEDALIRHLEAFLLELGEGFAFVARQKRIRLDTAWYRMDLVLFHRRLRCLVIIDLKIGTFTHADAGQMNLYLNYAREHLVEPGENEPIGLILCSEKSDTVVRYAMGGINARVFASEYRTSLPDEQALRAEIERARRAIALHRGGRGLE